MIHYRIIRVATLAHTAASNTLDKPFPKQHCCIRYARLIKPPSTSCLPYFSVLSSQTNIILLFNNKHLKVKMLPEPSAESNKLTVIPKWWYSVLKWSKKLNDRLSVSYNWIHSYLPGSEDSKLCADKNKKHCERSKGSELLTSHCCWVVWSLSCLPCWLPSPPLYSVKSATPCSNNPWPTGSRHNGLKITHHLPWQQLPTPTPIAHRFSTSAHLQYTSSR